MPHLIVIPGSKSTVSDLKALDRNGWRRQIVDHARRGGHVVGLCGGYQMLGRVVRDPKGIEGAPGEAEGLGLLDIETVMHPAKTVRNASARSVVHDVPLTGYEIHLGETIGPDCARPVAIIDGRPDGAISADGRVMGTYLHGLFDAGGFRRAFLAGFGIGAEAVDHRARIEAAVDAIADELETVVAADALLEAARPVRCRSDLR
ncbi:MAG: hypothetical protein ACN6I5_01060 [Hyphomicrobiales bacterium]